MADNDAVYRAMWEELQAFLEELVCIGGSVCVEARDFLNVMYSISRKFT